MCYSLTLDCPQSSRHYNPGDFVLHDSVCLPLCIFYVTDHRLEFGDVRYPSLHRTLTSKRLPSCGMWHHVVCVTGRYRRLGEICCLKCHYLSSRLHSIAFQKTVIFVFVTRSISCYAANIIEASCKAEFARNLRGNCKLCIVHIVDIKISLLLEPFFNIVNTYLIW
jgi:hypothetical protein